ncbi:uncharacterized protein EI90DRAFT_3045775 [Cantharellus anzutake]|uniref:uncharacterized protein n=1 Tax=Cantharellus anzutake TaxID=1750568 RepID=UPI00190633B9|nr:uncharacterized protein EI90DRAFT_3045775 [Cantharellus anzutake]KAF8336449.1 hypothetical protein EI90DRAFT_3045775 [Cantharellus anzutake]
MPRYANGTMSCLAIAPFIASLLGTSLRVYCGHKDTGDITPCSVDRPSADCVFLPDFLEGEWDLDILSPAGFNRMREISAYTKAEVANIEEH